MTIQALAPYYNKRADVKAAVDKAIAYWSTVQTANGGFGEGDWSGSETISQTIIAFSALDPSLFQDPRFIKNGNTILDAFLEYQTQEGSFKHLLNGDSDGMATEQACLALAAYSRALNKKNSLYDMTDAFKKDQGDHNASPEEVKAFMAKVNALPSTLRIKDKDTVSKLIVELDGMKDFENKENIRKSLKDRLKDIEKQEAEVKAVDQEIWNKIDPRKITIALKPTVQEIRARYNRLPKENKQFVKYYSDLVAAEKKIAEMEAAQKEENNNKQDKEPNKNPSKKPSSGKRPMQTGGRPAAVSSKKKPTSNVTATKNGMIKADDLKKIKGKDQNLKYEGEVKKDQKYTLTLHGKDIKEVKDMNAVLKEGSVYEKDIKKLAEDPYIFHFEQKGAFPAEMLVELNLPVEDGEYLLLKYNVKDRKAEFVQKIEIKDKNTKFLVKEGGDYFVTKKAKAESLNELEADEKDSKADEKTKETKREVADPEPESGAVEEADSNLTIIMTVVVVLLLAGIGGYAFYLKKGREKHNVKKH